MLLLDMLLPTPDSELSTLPMLEFAPTTLVLRFLASHKKRRGIGDNIVILQCLQC